MFMRRSIHESSYDCLRARRCALEVSQPLAVFTTVSFAVSRRFAARESLISIAAFTADKVRSWARHNQPPAEIQEDDAQHEDEQENGQAEDEQENGHEDDDESHESGEVKDGHEKGQKVLLPVLGLLFFLLSFVVFLGPSDSGKNTSNETGDSATMRCQVDEGLAFHHVTVCRWRDSLSICCGGHVAN